MKWKCYPQYKDSDIDWLGEIPEGWKVIRVGQTSKVIDPQPDHRAPALAEGEGFSYIGIRDVNNDGTVNFDTARKIEEEALIKQEKSFSINPGDIIFCKVGTLGLPRQIKPHGRLALSATLVLIKPDIKIDKDFLTYALDGATTYVQIELLSTGSTRAALGIEQIRKLKITFPPLNIQNVIANFLAQKTSRIDALIAKKEKQIELLKEKRSALISHVVTKGLDPNVKMKDSGIEWLGEIPEHWEVKRLKYSFKILNGSTPRSSEPLFWNGDISWATPDDLGNLDKDSLFKTKRSITKEGYLSCGTAIGPKGSLILSIRAPIGHLAIAGQPMCCNQGCRILVSNNHKNFKFYFYLIYTARPELEAWGQGSTFNELSRTKLENIFLVLPPDSEKKNIKNLLDQETSKIDSLLKKIQKSIELLKEYRTALISAAVTGKIDVREEV